MRALIVFCLFIFLQLNAFPTGQASDIIIWKNEKPALFSNPLESYPDFELIRERLFGIKNLSRSTGCLRGYIAEWQTPCNF